MSSHKDTPDNALVALVDATRAGGKAIGKDLGDAIKRIEEGDGIGVLKDAANGSVEALQWVGKFSRDVVRTLGEEVDGLVDQRGDDPQIGRVVKVGGGFMHLLLSGLNGIGSFSSWAGSAFEGAFAKLGVGPKKKD
jgi:hypothetical protein